jgi:hypothetical protein
MDSFRDEKLRINDDRKVRMSLTDFSEPDCMILLLVRSFDTRGEKVADGAFAHSWFRLQNEQTNQTIDYTKIASVEVPEDYNEGEAPAADEDDADAEPVKRNELVYVVGRLYRDEAMEKRKPGAKWVYEKWSRVTTSEMFEDIASELAGIRKYLEKERVD